MNLQLVPNCCSQHEPAWSTKYCVSAFHYFKNSTSSREFLNVLEDLWSYPMFRKITKIYSLVTSMRSNYPIIVGEQWKATLYLNVKSVHWDVNCWAEPNRLRVCLTGICPWGGKRKRCPRGKIIIIYRFSMPLSTHTYTHGTCRQSFRVI